MWVRGLVTDQLSWIFLRNSVVSSILLADKIHDLATYWLCQTVRYVLVWIAGVPRATLLLIADQLVIGRACRCGQPMMGIAGSY